MEIAGRITNNATLHELKDGRQVINFSIVVNDSYKRRGEEQFTEVATFFNCSYWRNPGIVQHLTKGKLVQVYGRISISVYNNAEGEARGSLQFHVNDLKFIGNRRNNTADATTPEPVTAVAETDDAPF